MTREIDEIQKAMENAGHPSIKKYIAVLVVAVAVVFLYSFFVHQPIEVSGYRSSTATNPSYAQETSNNINEDVQQISKDIENINDILGVS